MMKTIGNEILDGLAVMLSVENYDELETQAKEMARQEYESKKNDAKMFGIYNYIMDRYMISITELIEILTSAFMLRLAVENDEKLLIEEKKKELLDYREWFSGKRDVNETNTYDYFTELYRNCVL